MTCRINPVSSTPAVSVGKPGHKGAAQSAQGPDPVGGGTLKSIVLKAPIEDPTAGCGGFGQDSFSRGGGAIASTMSPAVLAQQGGGILSNNGANIVSNNGANVVSNNGANATGGGGAQMVIVGPPASAGAATGNSVMDFWKNLIAPIRNAAQDIVNWVQLVIDATKPGS